MLAKMTTRTGAYKSICDVVESVLEQLRPAERLTVSEAASKYVRIVSPGSFVGYYSNELTPYMIEPADQLLNPDLTGLIFVGPAQSSKTQSLIVNWIGYSVVCDPMDMIVYSPTQGQARDFSKRRIDRLHRQSDVIGAMLRPDRDADNIFDKHYKNGMMLTLGHPSSAEFAGKPIARVALTDYDRMDEDIDGEGSPYDLANKRTTTYGSFGMTLAESSPSRELTNPQWIASTKHEAPPTTGILALYNRGDRRRFYWPCPRCGGYFEGMFKHLKFEKKPSVSDSADSVYMECSMCDGRIEPRERKQMNAKGVWVPDGMYVNSYGKLHGTPMRSSIASYWLMGVAAAFVTWGKLIEGYLTAENEYRMTGSEEALKKFYNTDLAEIYIPKSMQSERTPEQLKNRALPLAEKHVPKGVRFLLATIDVQKNMFVVQVHGIMPGQPFDMVLVDRFNLYKSERRDADGDVEWVKPHVYEEDWDQITLHVINREYPLADESGRMMGVRFTVCDSGGRAGATDKAYSYYRRLRQAGLHMRFRLVKGHARPNAPRVQEIFPDSSDKGRKDAARGDIPILEIQTNLVKDMLSNRLDSMIPGQGMYTFPDWLPDWFFAEMCSEVRTEKGWGVINKHKRNEAWDLSVYAIALAISKYIRVEILDWDKPQPWYADWGSNDHVRKPETLKSFARDEERKYDFGKLAEDLA